MSFLSACLRYSFYFAICLACGAILVASSAYLFINPNLPDPKTLKETQFQIPLRIYTEDNLLIGEFGEKRRTPLAYQDTPPLFLQALLAAEDDRFLEHHGVDIKGLLRAAVQLASTGHIQSGGSTITMQVAKNFFLSSERTFSRKFSEILLAIKIEHALDKQEILELYINKIYLGHRAYGAQAAAQVYYDRDIQQLTLAELAMLAGLPKAPSAYNPIANPERALQRRNWILGRMLTLGYIEQGSYDQAVSAAITASVSGPQLDFQAPFIAELARREIIERYGKEAYTLGLRVITTANGKLQQAAQHAVSKGIEAYDSRHGYRGPEGNLAASEPDPAQWPKQLKSIGSIGPNQAAAITSKTERSLTVITGDNESLTLDWQQGLEGLRPQISINSRAAAIKSTELWQVGDVIRIKQGAEGSWQLSQAPDVQAALVSLRPQDGAIKAIVGGYDFYASKFNRATLANRQPGSNFKPFIYAAALHNGFTAASIINDAPVVFDDKSLESTWRPENDGGRFYGPTRLRKALYKSRNLVSIRILKEMGVSKAIDFVSKFGFDQNLLPKDLSLALGSHAVTPLQVATAYAAFANQGYKISPYLIDRIESSDGEILFQANPATAYEPEAIEPTSNLREGSEEANLEELLAEANGIEAATPAAERIMDPRVTYIMNSIMRDVIKKGTGRRARVLQRNDIGGKTGTTNGPTDAWFSGYSPDIVTTTWLGFDKNQTLGRREYGGSAALPIWIDYMRVALADFPDRIPEQPAGIVSVLIDPKTGERASPGQSGAIFEIFRSENTPKPINRQAPKDIIDSTLPEELF